MWLHHFLVHVWAIVCADDAAGEIVCVCVCVRVCVWAHHNPYQNVRALSVGVDRVWLGSQAFWTASAFNQILASWNVLRVLDMSNSFDSTMALSTSTKGTMYLMWGATLQAAYPTWACGNAGMLTCITNANIASAVTAWMTGPTTAATTYGPIGYWNTAAVTSMDSLFYPSSTARPTFNDDISKWNVASVSTMASVCSRTMRARALNRSGGGASIEPM
jgi:hypothetical protein